MGGGDTVRAWRRPATRWSSSTWPLGAFQLDSLDGVVEDGATERLDISPGLGEAGDDEIEPGERQTWLR